MARTAELDKEHYWTTTSLLMKVVQGNQLTLESTDVQNVSERVGHVAQTNVQLVVAAL